MNQQDISYQDKLNELRLDISHPNSRGRVFVFVEGETDIRLFRKLFNLDNCKVENIPGGKLKLEKCVGELVPNHALIIGIRDADFTHLSTTPYTISNMFLTDFHDIEMSLIAEDEVFSAIVFEFTKLSKQAHNAVREDILEIIEEISLLKWLNTIEDLRIEFGETGFQDIISFVNNSIDFEEYFRRLLSKSLNANITDIAIIRSKIDTLKSSNPDAFHLSNGHDFIKVFSQFLRVKGNVKSVSNELISSIFRTNFRNDLFAKTLLYQNTKQWADANNCSIHL
jgi:hypothetical protein